MHILGIGSFWIKALPFMNHICFIEFYAEEAFQRLVFLGREGGRERDPLSMK
jgi:hypothetical protein